MIKEAIFKAVMKQNLSFKESETVLDEIMSGSASQIQMSAFLTAMSMKKETIEEITMEEKEYSNIVAVKQSNPNID